MRIRSLAAAAVCVLGIAAISGANAQDSNTGLPPGYPSKPLRVIVGSSPGGGTDITARYVLGKLSELWHQAIVIEDEPGANGLLSIEYTAKAAPDGYTLVVASNSALLTAEYAASFDVKSTLEPVAILSQEPYIFAVANQLPVHSIPEFLAYAKANPGKLNYASAGVGSGTHIATEEFDLMTGIKMQHVPFKGIGPGLVEMMAGRIDTLIASPQSATGPVHNGQIRAIAVTSDAPYALLPGLRPVAADVPGFDLYGIYGLLAPANTPKPIVDAINRDIRKVLASPETTAWLAKSGAEGAQSSPTEYRTRIEKELAAAGEIIHKTGMKLN